jgi:hypothetical protein
MPRSDVTRNMMEAVSCVMNMETLEFDTRELAPQSRKLIGCIACASYVKRKIGPIYTVTADGMNYLSRRKFAKPQRTRINRTPKPGYSVGNPQLPEWGYHR